MLILKALVTGVIVVVISEVSKRSSLIGAVIASLPLTSILAMTWLYLDTRDVTRVEALSIGIFWMVLPSLCFLLIFPLLLRKGVTFFPALIAASIAMAFIYFLYVHGLKKAGIEI